MLSAFLLPPLPQGRARPLARRAAGQRRAGAADADGNAPVRGGTGDATVQRDHQFVSLRKAASITICSTIRFPLNLPSTHPTAARCRQSWLAEHVQGGVLLPEAPQLSLFEQQLAGCRTFKAQPIPSVDTSASLRALDAHTPEQRQQAQAFTAAVSACANFRCLRQANKLVRRRGGGIRGQAGDIMGCSGSRAASSSWEAACLCTSGANSSAPPHLQPRAPGQFRFPHFMVIGFPKCATTSIYW